MQVKISNNKTYFLKIQTICSVVTGFLEKKSGKARKKRKKSLDIKCILPKRRGEKNTERKKENFRN